MTEQIIELQPFYSGWQVCGVEAAASPSFFTGPSAIEHAIDYAWEAMQHRTGEIRLLGRNGEIIAATPLWEKPYRAAASSRRTSLQPVCGA